MTDTSSDNVLALASIMQTATLVDHLAYTGNIKDRACFNATIRSLITTNQDSVLDIYSSVDNLRLGIEDLQDYCGRRKVDQKSLALKFRYAKELYGLGKILTEDSVMAQNLRVDLSPDKVARHKKSIPALVKYLAQVYYDNFSCLPTKKRIVVLGRKEHISAGNNVDMIRALLFAGIRASLLWKSYGGTMLFLFARRKQMLHELSEVMQSSSRNILNK